MRYRIINNKNGKFRVQSKAHFLVRWHDRGSEYYVDYTRLGWHGTDFDTLVEAETVSRACKAYDLLKEEF